MNTSRLNPSQTGQYSIYLPRRDGRLSWSRWLVAYIQRWFTRPQSATHVSTITRQCMHGRESNSRLVDHKSDAITTTTPSHLCHCSYMFCLLPEWIKWMYYDCGRRFGCTVRMERSLSTRCRLFANVTAPSATRSDVYTAIWRLPAEIHHH